MSCTLTFCMTTVYTSCLGTGLGGFGNVGALANSGGFPITGGIGLICPVDMGGEGGAAHPANTNTAHHIKRLNAH